MAIYGSSGKSREHILATQAAFPFKHMVYRLASLGSNWLKLDIVVHTYTHELLRVSAYLAAQARPPRRQGLHIYDIIVSEPPPRPKQQVL